MLYQMHITHDSSELISHLTLIKDDLSHPLWDYIMEKAAETFGVNQPISLRDIDDTTKFAKLKQTFYGFGYFTQLTCMKMVKFANGPILSLGSGNAWGEYMISQAGGHVDCTDNGAWMIKHYPVSSYTKFTAVDAVTKFPKHKVLFISWAPMAVHMSYDEDAIGDPHDFEKALKMFYEKGGEKVICIGEGDGCTGTDEFNMALYENFTLSATYCDKREAYLDDCIRFYMRKDTEWVDGVLPE